MSKGDKNRASNAFSFDVNRYEAVLVPTVDLPFWWSAASGLILRDEPSCVPVFIWGVSGSGKSTAIRKLAEEVNWTVAEVNLVSKEIGAAFGLAIPRREGLTRVLSSDWQKIANRRRGVLLLEELNRSIPQIQNEVLPSLVSGELAEGKVIGPGVVRVGLGNLPEEIPRGQSTLTPALTMRFAHFELAPQPGQLGSLWRRAAESSLQAGGPMLGDAEEAFIQRQIALSKGEQSEVDPEWLIEWRHRAWKFAGELFKAGEEFLKAEPSWDDVTTLVLSHASSVKKDLTLANKVAPSRRTMTAALKLAAAAATTPERINKWQLSGEEMMAMALTAGAGLAFATAFMKWWSNREKALSIEEIIARKAQPENLAEAQIQGEKAFLWAIKPWGDKPNSPSDEAVERFKTVLEWLHSWDAMLADALVALFNKPLPEEAMKLTTSSFARKSWGTFISLAGLLSRLSKRYPEMTEIAREILMKGSLQQGIER